jgi:DNA-binding SARP family transcriptional activator
MHASVFGIFRLEGKEGQEIIISNKRARAILAMLYLAPDEPLERKLVVIYCGLDVSKRRLRRVCVNVYSN